ncbi:MAG: 5-formyltetrahydrofolate cyclo-ligase [Arachnia sp.]
MLRKARKDALRRHALDSRARLGAEAWAAEDAARSRHVLGRLAGRVPGCAASYVSRVGEPDTRAVISWLWAAGWRVLLPATIEVPDWAEFTGWEAMRPGPVGIDLPTGKRLGASALAVADVVIVPALGVGPDGTRLGVGAGWYDRALPWRAPGAAVWALTRADERFDTPREAHDVPVAAAITEAGVDEFDPG